MVRLMRDRPKILLGTEIEYGVNAIDRDEQTLSPSWLARMMLRRAELRPHLPGAETGQFLTNGSRCLIEPAGHASHFEVASPETRSPFDAVRYELAGDRLVAQLAQEVARANASVDQIWVRKGGIDYLERTTWGAHENYLFYLRPPEDVRPEIVSHCVSRIVFAGAGGFDGDGRFVLSPRATFMRDVVAASRPEARALVDTRDEPHCVGHNRLHLMCGDHLRGHLANVLKLGTTALVVALADAGCVDAAAIHLANPLDALETINHDQTLRRTVELADGRAVTAVDIQRHYLVQVQRHLHLLPEWAGRVCDLWAEALTRLKEGSHCAADCLEWSLKLMLFRDRVARHGARWPLNGHREEGRTRSREITSRLMAELYEVDLRFAQIYPPSLFDELATAPPPAARVRGAWFRHEVTGVDEIDRALAEAPRGGRGHVRGTVVQRLAAHAASFTCTWDSINSRSGRSRLDLTDPFVETEIWTDGHADRHGIPDEVWALLGHLDAPTSAATPGRIRELAGMFLGSDAMELRRLSVPYAADINNRALEFRDSGRLDEAEWLLRAALAIDLEGVGPWKKVSHRRNNLATVLIMQGRLAEARQQLTMAWQLIGTRYDLTSARVLTMRLTTAFLADERVQLFLGQLKRHVKMQPLPDFANVSNYWRAECVIRAVAPMLDECTVGLLGQVVAVLNREQVDASLDLWQSWRDAQVCPLEFPWPADGPDLGRRAPG
jgi:proteasome accessory factor A